MPPQSLKQLRGSQENTLTANEYLLSQPGIARINTSRKLNASNLTSARLLYRIDLLISVSAPQSMTQSGKGGPERESEKASQHIQNIKSLDLVRWIETQSDLAYLRDIAGLIQSVSQALLPGLRAWVEVDGIAPSQCSKAFLPQPISI